MVAIIPMSRSFLRTSPALTPMARARSATVITSEMRITRFDARGTVISVFFCSFPGSARRFCGRLPPRMKSRSMVSSMSDFLMTLRPFFFLGAPSAAAASAPGAGSAPRAAGEGAGAAGLRRSILPRTFTPRISSNPGGGGAGTGPGTWRAGRGAAAGGAADARGAAGSGAAAGGGGAGRSAAGEGAAGAGVALGHDPLRDHPLGADDGRRARHQPERLAHALHLLVGERALRALAADGELLEPRQEVLRLHVPFPGQLVDALGHRATSRPAPCPATASRRAPRAPPEPGSSAASAPGRGGG